MASNSYRCIGKDKDKSGCPQHQEHTNTRWECTFRTRDYEEFTRHSKNIVKRSNWRDLVNAVQKDQSGFYQCVYYSSDRKHVENHFKSSTNPPSNANTNTDINNSSGSNSSLMSISSSEDSQTSSPLPQTDMMLSPSANNNSPASSNPSTPNNTFKSFHPSSTGQQRVTRTASHPTIHSKSKTLQKRFSYTNIHENNNNTKNNNILSSPNSPKKKRSDDESPDMSSFMPILPQELSKRVKTESIHGHSKHHAFSDPENSTPNLLDEEYGTPRTLSPTTAQSPPQHPYFTDNTKIEDILEYIQKKLVLADNQYNEILQKLHKEGFMIVSTLRHLTDELWSRLSLPLAVEVELKRELGHHNSKAMVSHWYQQPHWSPIQPQSPIQSANASPAQLWAFQQYANMCPPHYSSHPSFDEYDECEVQGSAESNALGSDDDLNARHVQEEREMADILPPVETPLTHVPMRSTHTHPRDSNLFNPGTLQSHDRHE